MFRTLCNLEKPTSGTIVYTLDSTITPYNDIFLFVYAKYRDLRIQFPPDEYPGTVFLISNIH